MSSELQEIEVGALKNRRPWLIAFGVVEILIASFFVLVVVFMALFFFWLPARSHAPQFFPVPAAMKVFLGAVYGFMAAVFFIIGTGSILCKNWARIASLVVSGFWLGAGILTSVIMWLVIPRMLPQQNASSVVANRGVFLFVQACTVFAMVVAPAVFLVFYSRKSVRATCLTVRVNSDQVPKLKDHSTLEIPVPLVILGLWEGWQALSVFGFILVRATVLFGVVVHGAAAFLTLLLYSALSGYAAWLIFHRKLAGWGIALFTTVFWTASAVALFFRHGVTQLSRELAVMPRQAQSFQQFPRLVHVTLGASLTLMIALLIFLLYTRKFFVKHVAAST